MAATPTWATKLVAKVQGSFVTKRLYRGEEGTYLVDLEFYGAIRTLHRWRTLSANDAARWIRLEKGDEDYELFKLKYHKDFMGS